MAPTAPLLPAALALALIVAAAPCCWARPDRAGSGGSKLGGTEGATARHLQSSTTCVKRYMDFTNGKVPWGFYVEYGSATPNPEGLRLSSWPQNNAQYPYANTRMYYDNGVRNSPYLFNTADRPITHIMVWFRGAPDVGKNSAVYLLQPNSRATNVNDPSHGSNDGGLRDEVDLIEYYGSTKRAESNFYRGGMKGPFVLPNGADGGNKDYMYEMWLERGTFLKLQLTTAHSDPAQRTVLSSKTVNLDVPVNPMRLIASIWDCQRDVPAMCSGSFGSTAQMCIRGLWINNCDKSSW